VQTRNRPSSFRPAFRIVIAALAAITTLLQFAGAATAAGSIWSAGYVPNVPVIDQNGRELKFYDDVIKDKIVIVSFIYTVCKDVCPLVTARLAQLQEKLGPLVGNEIHFVSISIDPERDTPQRLKEYAEAFRVAPGWTFLTGKVEDIDQIRYKLGERSRALNEHRNEILLGNARTGEWARDSAFADLVVLAANVRNMDPDWLNRLRPTSAEVMPVAAPSASQTGHALFVKTCGSCHTLGKGDRVGPDLAGLLDRRDRSWVEDYVAAPEKVRARLDPIALQLSQRFRAVRMPNLGMAPQDIADLLQYMESQSKTASRNQP
jgi:protein SCO1